MLSLISLSSGFNAPGAALPMLQNRVHVRMSEPAATDEAEVAVEEPESIFTLQDREDGWNDLRGAIKTFKKEREKPWKAIKEDYIEPTARWTNAIKEVTLETLEEADIELPSLEAPTIDLKKIDLKGVVTPTAPTREQVIKSSINTLNGALDAAASRKQKAAEKAAAKAAPKKAARPLKATAAEAVNFSTFLGLPAVVLAVLAPIVLPLLAGMEPLIPLPF